MGHEGMSSGKCFISLLIIVTLLFLVNDLIFELKFKLYNIKTLFSKPLKFFKYYTLLY